MSAGRSDVASSAAKRCVVVGVSGYVGRAVCLELARRGARVAGTFHEGEDAAAELGRSIDGFVARRLDLARLDDVERVVGELARALGGADALVVCATAVSTAAPEPTFDRLADVVPSKLVELLTVNVAAPLLAARAFAGVDGSSAGPRNVVLLGSIDGAKSVPSAAPYAASKGALVAAARALAKELAPRGILVNVVAPGLLDGGASRFVPADVKKEYLKHSGAKRFGSADEVARAVAWLALSNTYVDGQTLVLDGGL